MVDEMIKFRNLLDKNSIKWIDKSDEGFIDRTHFYYRDYFFSVINGYGTYGGIDVFTSKNHGLLELMSNCTNGGEPIGSLTANEAFEIVLGGKDGL